MLEKGKLGGTKLPKSFEEAKLQALNYQQLNIKNQKKAPSVADVASENCLTNKESIKPFHKRTVTFILIDNKHNRTVK